MVGGILAFPNTNYNLNIYVNIIYCTVRTVRYLGDTDDILS